METIVCPKCFAELEVSQDLKYCPRCGLADVVKAAIDTGPMEIKSISGTYRVLDRLSLGSLASLYRCTTASGQTAILKIARDALGNAPIMNEARILRQLSEAKDAEALAPFIPRMVDSFAVGGSISEPARHANVLQYHAEIATPESLYTLDEVRDAHPAGLDAKDVAWLWRRLLHVLSLAHNAGITHAAVLPGHVLIEPTGHKLVLIDWCFAVTRDRWSISPENAGIGAMRKWYQRNGVARPSSPSLDIALGARCMLQLLEGKASADGDSKQADVAPVDPAMLRHFKRGIELPDDPTPDAAVLLLHFDKLIEALWGARKFHLMTMPPRKTASR